MFPLILSYQGTFAQVGRRFIPVTFRPMGSKRRAKSLITQTQRMYARDRNWTARRQARQNLLTPSDS